MEVFLCCNFAKPDEAKKAYIFSISRIKGAQATVFSTENKKMDGFEQY